MPSHLTIRPGVDIGGFSQKAEILGSIKGGKNRYVVNLNRFITTTYALYEGEMVNEVINERRNDLHIRVSIKNRNTCGVFRNRRIVSRRNQPISGGLLEALVASVGGNQSADRCACNSTNKRRCGC